MYLNENFSPPQNMRFKKGPKRNNNETGLVLMGA